MSQIIGVFLLYGFILKPSIKKVTHLWLCHKHLDHCTLLRYPKKRWPSRWLNLASAHSPGPFLIDPQRGFFINSMQLVFRWFFIGVCVCVYLCTCVCFLLCALTCKGQRLTLMSPLIVFQHFLNVNVCMVYMSVCMCVLMYGDVRVFMCLVRGWHWVSFSITLDTKMTTILWQGLSLSQDSSIFLLWVASLSGGFPPWFPSWVLGLQASYHAHPTFRVLLRIQTLVLMFERWVFYLLSLLPCPGLSF